MAFQLLSREIAHSLQNITDQFRKGTPASAITSTTSNTTSGEKLSITADGVLSLAPGSLVEAVEKLNSPNAFYSKDKAYHQIRILFQRWLRSGCQTYLPQLMDVTQDFDNVTRASYIKQLALKYLDVIEKRWLLNNPKPPIVPLTEYMSDYVSLSLLSSFQILKANNF